jgi:hypothetical protein
VSFLDFEISPSRWNQGLALIRQDQHKPKLALAIGMLQNF